VRVVEVHGTWRSVGKCVELGGALGGFKLSLRVVEVREDVAFESLNLKRVAANTVS